MRSQFRLARRHHLGIFRATQPFVADGVAVPTGGAKKFCGLNRQVFVELRAHAPFLRRKRQDPFLRQIGGVGQGGLNSLSGERWVAANDFAGGQPVCQTGQHDGNRNSRAANADLAVKDGRIDRDVVLPGQLSNAAFPTGQERHPRRAARSPSLYCVPARNSVMCAAFAGVLSAVMRESV